MAAGALVAAPDAGAVTPHEQFLKDLERIAPFPPAKAKRLCRCTDVTGHVGELRPGYGASNGLYSYTLVCQVPTFNTYEGTVSWQPCPGNQFAILEK